MLKTQLAAPRIEVGKPLLLGGLRQTYSMSAANDLSQQWQRFVPHMAKLSSNNSKVAYGAVFHASGADNFDYLTAVEISGPEKAPAEFSSVSIPAQRYAIFPHPGNVSEIKSTIREIWEHWMPSSGYRRAADDAGSVSMLERYGEGFDPKTGTGDMELWIPIKN